MYSIILKKIQFCIYFLYIYNNKHNIIYISVLYRNLQIRIFIYHKKFVSLVKYEHVTFYSKRNYDVRICDLINISLTSYSILKDIAIILCMYACNILLHALYMHGTHVYSQEAIIFISHISNEENILVNI